MGTVDRIDILQGCRITAVSTEILSRKSCPRSSAEIFQNLSWYISWYFFVMFLQHCLGSLAEVLVISLVGSISVWVLWILFLSSVEIQYSLAI